MGSVVDPTVISMLLGYARVWTAEQNPDHQLDALHRAGVATDVVYLGSP